MCNLIDFEFITYSPKYDYAPKMQRLSDEQFALERAIHSIYKLNLNDDDEPVCDESGF